MTAEQPALVSFASVEPLTAPRSLAGTWQGQLVEVSRGLDVQIDPAGDRLELRLHAQAETPPWMVLRWSDGWSVYSLPLSTQDTFTATCSIAFDDQGPVGAQRGSEPGPGRTARGRQRRVEPRGKSQNQPYGLQPRSRPVISFARGRSVARALYLMMESGKIGPGIELAKEASELLASKYADPIGAAYGGLLLHRFGALQERASWIENLAHDFDWLPDGRILLAALLSRSSKRSERDRGLEHLLQATTNLPTVFSEAFSLGVSLLRRWPDETAAERCQERLASLRDLVGHYDFASSCSLVYWPKPPKSGEWWK